MKPVPTFVQFFDLMKAKGYQIFDSASKPYDLNIVGWRDKEGKPNDFCDYISLYFILPNHKWEGRYYPATTRPGTPYLSTPINAEGAALLVPGQYHKAYELGPFKGYEALKQVKPVLVRRDNNKDLKFDDTGKVESGLFGIHIHKAGVFSKLVNRSSAGCQVFEQSADFEDFIKYCQLAAEKWGNSFTYTLLEF